MRAPAPGGTAPSSGECTYYERRKELVGAQVIVANHDLLLSSLGSRLLPELDQCLLVLDEGHHLPATALDQFACDTDLSRTHWVDKLASRTVRIGGQLAVSEVADVPRLAAQLRQTQQDLARLVMESYGDVLKAPTGNWGPARARAPHGRLPPRTGRAAAPAAGHGRELPGHHRRGRQGAQNGHPRPAR
jgi:ATP-dependent DNA helicase DinG